MRTVNDTIIADPVYAIPLKIVNGNIPGSNGDVSLCYEIHGSPDTWFNLISDTCLSVNAHYLEAELADNRIGHIVDRLGALIVSRTSQCRQAMVSMVEGVCSFTVDGSSVEMFDEDGVMVTKRRNRVRISAPNCDNQMVIIWAVCEKFSGVDMMKIVVNRGFNLNPTSHGFIGEFWHFAVEHADSKPWRAFTHVLIMHTYAHRHTRAHTHTHAHTHTYTHTHAHRERERERERFCWYSIINSTLKCTHHI